MTSPEKQIRGLESQLLAVQSDLLFQRKETARLLDFNQTYQKQLDSLRENIMRLFMYLNLPNTPQIDKLSEVDKILEELCQSLKQ